MNLLFSQSGHVITELKSPSNTIQKLQNVKLIPTQIQHMAKTATQKCKTQSVKSDQKLASNGCLSHKITSRPSFSHSKVR